VVQAIAVVMSLRRLPGQRLTLTQADNFVIGSEALTKPEVLFVRLLLKRYAEHQLESGR
jgi:hypothetical protein